MATVTLRTVWLNDVVDPTDNVSFPNMAALTIGTGVTGGVRRLAGGRDRVINRATADRSPALDLPACDRAQVEWLEEHIATILCVRDDRGRKLFAIYAEVQVDELPYTAAYGNVKVALTEVTYTESY